MRLLLISGSLRERSTNTAALKTVRALSPAGVESTLYGEMGSLPHFNPDSDREGVPVNPTVTRLRERINWADAVIICTPEYAGALPGSLKNLLEWTVGDASTYRKPVAWINVSGPAAPTGGSDAHDSLRKVLGYVHAEVIEAACLRLPLTRDAVSTNGELHNPDDRHRIANMLASLVTEVERRHERS